MAAQTDRRKADASEEENLNTRAVGLADDQSEMRAPDLELVRAELLDPEGWREVLGTYAQTMGVAVAMTNLKGQQCGTCYNAQPIWLVVNDTSLKRDGSTEAGCSFCLDLAGPCQAVETALSTGLVALVNDRAGLAHLAVPLALGQHVFGAIVAGQVFDRYPEQLRLNRMAQKLGVSAQKIWQVARLQLPIRKVTLKVYGDLLLTLSKAFLQQRYAAILVRELARASLRLRLSLDGVKSHALFTVDEKGAVTSWNQGAGRLFGYTESDVLGKDFARFFVPDDIKTGVPANLLNQANRNDCVNDQGWQVRQDGTRFFAEGSLTVLGKDGSREFGRLIHDVTERRNSELALRQSQKLESIGVLASGIAHDFNNLLTGILGGVSFARNSLQPQHAAYPLLVLAEQASEKAAELTHQLLAYGGQGKFVVAQFDLSALIRDMLPLLKTSIPKSVDLRLALEESLPWIEADASQVQQIVMNLVINGAESIGLEGGTLRVSTGAAAAEPAGAQSGIEAWMEVCDSGSGMSEETKARIFDPFFTTKFTGRGLGLAAVSGIVRGHQGRMQVDSAIGSGSTFRIWFPAIERPGQPEQKSVAAKDVRGSGTVLIVDDEPALRMMAQAILEDNGYDVVTAEDGRQAVELFEQNGDTITAVLLDMTMPVMSGEEAFRRLRALRADLPIVVSTGYSEDTVRGSFDASAATGFVQKPYTATQLCQRIYITSRPLNGRLRAPRLNDLGHLGMLPRQA